MENKQSCAPVVIGTLCRHEHFINCIESLSRCNLSDLTDVYIGVDYPFHESHREGREKILEYIETIKGFRSVTVIKRDINYGSVKNIRELIISVLAKHDCFILSEDDNVFSVNFLEYINKGLDKYKTDPRVFAICGFAYPEFMDKASRHISSKIYATRGYSAWGVGFWKEKYEEYRPVYMDPNFALQLLKSTKLITKLFRNRRHLMVKRLIRRIPRGQGIGDLMWRIFLVIEDKYCIMPLTSKVRNCGHDGSGLLSIKNDLYSAQLIDSDTHFIYDDIEISEPDYIKRKLDRMYGGTWLFRRIIEFQYWIYRISGINPVYFFDFIRSVFRKK